MAFSQRPVVNLTQRLDRITHRSVRGQNRKGFEIQPRRTVVFAHLHETATAFAPFGKRKTVDERLHEFGRMPHGRNARNRGSSVWGSVNAFALNATNQPSLDAQMISVLSVER